MQPSPNRNRLVESRQSAELAHAYRLQLNEKQCAQKELNLQPAGYYRRGDELVIALRGVNYPSGQGAFPPSNPEGEDADRFGTVTEAGPFPAPSHKASSPQYALENRPDLLGFLEAVTLSVAMGSTRVLR